MPGSDRYEVEVWERPGLTMWRVLDRITGGYVREPSTEDKPQVFASEHCARAWINREHAATP